MNRAADNISNEPPPAKKCLSSTQMADFPDGSGRNPLYAGVVPGWETPISQPGPYHLPLYPHCTLQIKHPEFEKGSDNLTGPLIHENRCARQTSPLSLPKTSNPPLRAANAPPVSACKIASVPQGDSPEKTSRESRLVTGLVAQQQYSSKPARPVVLKGKKTAIFSTRRNRHRNKWNICG